MNEYHKLCGSDEWRAVVRDSMLPWALGDLDLGDDVLEVGPGYGATTDVLGELVPKLTAVEIDPDLTAMLMDRFAAKGSVSIVRGATALEFPDGRFSGAASFTMLHHVPTVTLQDRLFAEVGRVLRSGGVFVVGDGAWRALNSRLTTRATPTTQSTLKVWLSCGVHKLDFADDQGSCTPIGIEYHHWCYRVSTLVPWLGSDGSADASSLARGPDDVFGTHKPTPMPPTAADIVTTAPSPDRARSCTRDIGA